MRFEVPTLPPSVKEPTVNYGYGADLEFEGKAAKPAIPLVMSQEPVWFVLLSIHTAIRSRVVPDFEEFFA